MIMSSQKNISSFFSRSQDKSSVSGSQGGKKKESAILITDSEDERPQPSASSSKASFTTSKHFPTSSSSKATNGASPSKANGAIPKKRTVSTIASSSEDESDEPPHKKKVSPAKSTTTKKKPTPKKSTSTKKSKEADDEFIVEDEDEDVDMEPSGNDEKDEPPRRTKAQAKAKPRTSKAKRAVSSSSDEDEIVPKKKSKPRTSAVSTSKKKAASPPSADTSKDNNKPKVDWRAKAAARKSGPAAPGSKEMPDGDPNALAGLTFVFTGELSSFSRDESVDLAKRFGGRVTGQPSSKTDYVVLGSDAGPKKLEVIKKHNLTTLSEDAFLELIATRKGVLTDAQKAKLAKEKQEIEKGVKELEKREKSAGKGKGKEASGEGGAKAVDPLSQLWTSRYAPTNMKEICGNKGQVTKLQEWLHDWQKNREMGFKKPGKNGMGQFRAVLIYGPPGIGKTTSAHMVAKMEGYTPVELNASDVRSKNLVESSTNVTNKSVDGWLTGGKMENLAGVTITDRSCLIMDEVDGMSAGDRGGVGALNALIKKTRIPIICLANDGKAQKLKPLQPTCFSLSFSRPTADTVRSRLMTILYKEKMQISKNVLDNLVNGVNSDLRQVLNMLSTWKLSQSTMDFDEGKKLAKANEKYAIMTPFNVVNKVLGPYLFSATSRETLGEKIEYYFHDHSFVPLFIQENYLKQEPSRARQHSGHEQALKRLQLYERASSSLSDSDLVDRMIHGSEQHWSLMPFHAVTSTVLPASYVYGSGAGYGGPNAYCFPGWLGQNSKQTKLQRQLTDVQIRMRPKVSGNKSEIRLSYLPALLPLFTRPLVVDGADGVGEVIERMDDYYMSKDDWDTILELGVGESNGEVVLKMVPTAVKTALTRKYNAAEHPIPFYKAADLGKAPKKLDAGPKPDLEDAFDVDEEIVDEEEDSKAKRLGADDDPLANDKLIKESKVGGKGKGRASAGGSKKSRT